MSGELQRWSPPVASALRDSRAPSTWRAYATAWAQFEAWAQARGLAALQATPADVATYLTERAEGGWPALPRAVSAIHAACEAAGVPSPARDPLVKTTLQGLKRRLKPQAKGKAALTADLLALCVRAARQGPTAVRDAAILLVGHAGAFRRSELVSLLIEDVEWREKGAAILLRQSKTDQTGEGFYKAIPYGGGELDAALALKAWLAVRGPGPGPIFTRAIPRTGRYSDEALSPQSVALIVKACAAAAKIDSAQYAGHSLRSGFVTDAFSAEAPIDQVQAQTGHKSVDVLLRYRKMVDPFHRNAVTTIKK